MDANANWRPTQGSDPAAAAAAAAGVDPNAPAGGDWRAHLQPEARSRIVNKIMETLKKHLPVSVPEGLTELQKIAVRFEEKVYTAATSQSDYLRKISLKLLSMETKTQQAPRNAQVIPNQNNPGQEENPADSLDAAARKKILTIRNKLEDLIQTAKQSDEGMDFLLSSVLSIEEPLNQKVPAAAKHSRKEEYETFIGCNIPTQVDIHPPNDVRSVGRTKRKKGKEMKGGERNKKNKEAKAKVARLCKTCHQVGFHDSRNCPSKKGPEKEATNVQDMHLDGGS